MILITPRADSVLKVTSGLPLVNLLPDRFNDLRRLVAAGLLGISVVQRGVILGFLAQNAADRSMQPALYKVELGTGPLCVRIEP